MVKYNLRTGAAGKGLFSFFELDVLADCRIVFCASETVGGICLVLFSIIVEGALRALHLNFFTFFCHCGSPVRQLLKKGDFSTQHPLLERKKILVLT